MSLCSAPDNWSGSVWYLLELCFPSDQSTSKTLWHFFPTHLQNHRTNSMSFLFCFMCVFWVLTTTSNREKRTCGTTSLIRCWYLFFLLPWNELKILQISLTAAHLFLHLIRSIWWKTTGMWESVLKVWVNPVLLVLSLLGWDWFHLVELSEVQWPTQATCLDLWYTQWNEIGMSRYIPW